MARLERAIRYAAAVTPAQGRAVAQRRDYWIARLRGRRQSGWLLTSPEVFADSADDPVGDRQGVLARLTPACFAI
jgi:hypothetical protein